MPDDFIIRKGDRLTDFADVDVIVERVERGGLGLVAMGPDRGIGGKWVALKTMRPDKLRQSPVVRDRFIREGLTWLGLWPHANLLMATTVTMIWEQPFLVLDYADGGSLRNVLDDYELTLEIGLQWAQMLAAGLDVLHTPDPDMLRERPIVHRDLKPENVLVQNTGLVQITDFGLAKVVESDPAALDALEEAEPELALPSHAHSMQTMRGKAFGTSAYMAPEQWLDGASAGPPADMYAYGIMLSELFAMRHALLDLAIPHSSEAWQEAHFSLSPRPLQQVAPRLPEAVEDLYQRCLEKRPEKRPSAREALGILQGVATAMGQEPYFPPTICPHIPVNELTQWHNWAAAYWRFDMLEGALERNARALAITPHDPASLLLRGSILMKQGQGDTALEIFYEALTVMSPDDPRSRVIRNQCGIVLKNLQRYAEAEQIYEQTLAMHQDYADCWSNRALNQGTWGDAEAAANRLVEARLHYEQAIRCIERAIAIDPQTAQHHRLRKAMMQGVADTWFSQGRDAWAGAQAQREAGNKAAARTAIEQAIWYTEQAIALNAADQRYRILLAVLKQWDK